MELANAAVDVVGNDLTVEDFLTYFGRCFIRSFNRYGYDKIMKVIINNFYITYIMAVSIHLRKQRKYYVMGLACL